MCSANRSSLEVSYVHLGDQAPILAIWLADVPRDMLEIFDEVLTEVVLTDFPHYSQVFNPSFLIIPFQITNELHVRITELPISDKLRDLRQSHLNCLVRVAGGYTDI